MRRLPLGIFGGTFDPIHYGHLELAREVAGRAATRRGAPRSLPATRRIARRRWRPPSSASRWWSSRSTDIRGLEVDRREVDRPGRSYTVLTLQSLRAEDPARPLALIVGADAFLGFPTGTAGGRSSTWPTSSSSRARAAVHGPLPPALADEWERPAGPTPRRRCTTPPPARSSCSRSRRTTSPPSAIRPRSAARRGHRRGPRFAPARRFGLY